MPLGIVSDDGVYTYTAWASALLVLLFRAMRRPQSVGRVTGKVPTLFSYIHFNTFLFNRLDLGIRAQKRKDKLPRKGLLFLMVHIGKAIKAELERYTEWLSKATDDPNNFVTMSQIEISDRDGVAYCDANC